jgi:hypothetical protein
VATLQGIEPGTGVRQPNPSMQCAPAVRGIGQCRSTIDQSPYKPIRYTDIKLIKKIALTFLVLIIVFVAVILIQPSRYETRYFNNGHGDIAYKQSGSGDAVILAHGFASDDYQWELMGLVDELDDHYRVITYDARVMATATSPRE